MRRFGSPLLAASSVLVGCGQPPPSPALRIAEVDGVRTVQVADLSRVPFPAWSTRPVFSTDGNDSLTLAPTVQAAFVADSALWIAAGSQVIVLGSNGNVRRSVGRAGDGPGEFRDVFHLGATATGTVLVSDFGSGRVAEFRPDGGLLRTVPRLSSAADQDIDPIVGLEGGLIIGTVWQQRPNRLGALDQSVGSLTRDSAPVILFDSTGAEVRRLGMWLGRERIRVDLDGEPAGLPRPFGATALYDGRSGYAVIGSTDSLSVSLYRGTDLILRLVAPRRREPPTRHHITDWERAVVSEDSTMGSAYLRAVVNAPPAAALPAYGGLLVDDSGNIWIGQYTVRPGAPRTWRVFSREGAPLGRVELPGQSPLIMPGSSELLDVSGDRLAVRRVTEAGETVVEVRELVQP